MAAQKWRVYLSGEIHSDWREIITQGVAAGNLPIEITSPNTNHADSDDCGVLIFGDEPDKFWHDRKGAQLNSMRNGKLIAEADIVVVRFGEKYKQWNAAFDAGYAAALGKAIITLHPPEHDHALKEVDAAAKAMARTPEQVVEAFSYLITGALPSRQQTTAAE